MVILPATEADLQAVIELVAQGRAALARQGVDQWQDGYPSPETIRRDLLRGDGRIVRIDGAAAGLRRLRLRRANRPTTGSRRAAGPPKGLMWRCTGWSWASASCGGALPPRCCAKPPARRSCAASARSGIDTHPDNGPMRALLVREGFACRGKVRYEAVRLAYEKPIFG